MLRIGKASNYSPAEVLERAIAYFGPDGVGLEPQEQSEEAVQFVGAGGHVLVQVAPQTKGTDVDIQTREFDYDVKQFLHKI